jgi:hypothetical protein
VPKKEDTPVVSELIRRGQLVLLDRPELYVYTHHGKNTWDRRHWQHIIDAAQPLPDETSQALAALLDASPPPEQSQTVIENAICKSLADRSRRSRTALRLR